MVMVADVETTYSSVDEVVVNEAYSTAGNGGRKFVLMDDGTFVIGVREPTKGVRLYKKGEQDHIWSEFHFFSAPNIVDFALVKTQNKVVITSSNSDNRVRSTVVSEEGTQVGANVYIDQNQTELSFITSAVDPLTGHIHAAWLSKNTQYPNAFNIRYAKSVDGGVKWSTVEQLFPSDTISIKSLTMVIGVDSKVHIIFPIGAAGSYGINQHFHDGTKWTYNRPMSGTFTQEQYFPSAVVDRKSGTIHVTWHGKDPAVGNWFSIYYLKSTDKGLSWTNALVIASRDSFHLSRPSISLSVDGIVFVTYSQGSDGTTFLIKYNGTSWDGDYRIGQGNFGITLEYAESLIFTIPPTVMMTSTNILFSGEWEILVEEPTITATVVYDIPSTDFVGAFVEKAGNVTVEAFLNDELMDDELEGNEYQFAKVLQLKAPAKLRLELSRPDTSGGEADALTRILGGCA